MIIKSNEIFNCNLPLYSHPSDSMRGLGDDLNTQTDNRNSYKQTKEQEGKYLLRFRLRLHHFCYIRVETFRDLTHHLTGSKGEIFPFIY